MNPRTTFRTLVFGHGGDGLRQSTLIFLITVVALAVSPGIARLDVAYGDAVVATIMLGTLGGLGLVTLFRAGHAAYRGDGFLSGVLPIAAMSVAIVVMSFVGDQVFGNRSGESPFFLVALGLLVVAIVAGSVAYLVGYAFANARAEN